MSQQKKNPSKFHESHAKIASIKNRRSKLSRKRSKSQLSREPSLSMTEGNGEIPCIISSTVMKEELARLTTIYELYDENNNEILTPEEYETKGTKSSANGRTVRLEACPEIRVLGMHGDCIHSSDSGAIPKYSDSIFQCPMQLVKGQTFTVPYKMKSKSAFTSTFYRCHIVPQMFQEQLGKAPDSMNDFLQQFQQINQTLEISPSGLNTSSNLPRNNNSSLVVIPSKANDNSSTVDCFTGFMQNLVPEDFETRVLSNAMDLGAQMLNAGLSIANSFLPDGSESDAHEDIIRLNGYEIRLVGRSLLLQAIYVNSTFHGVYPPLLDVQTIDPFARLRLWVQFRQDSSRPHIGLHGYNVDNELEPQLTLDDGTWTLSFGERSFIKISVPSGTSTSRITRTSFPNGSMIIQAP